MRKQNNVSYAKFCWYVRIIINTENGRVTDEIKYSPKSDNSYKKRILYDKVHDQILVTRLKAESLDDDYLYYYFITDVVVIEQEHLISTSVKQLQLFLKENTRFTTLTVSISGLDINLNREIVSCRAPSLLMFSDNFLNLR